MRDLNNYSIMQSNLLTEAIIPIPSRMIIVNNHATPEGEKIFKEILPETWKSHIEAQKRAEDFVKNNPETDYRTDSRYIQHPKFGKLLLMYTEYYWYTGMTPAVTVVSFDIHNDIQIDVYDFIVDTKVFTKEMNKLYKAKVSGKVDIAVAANNTDEQKKYPRLVELANMAKKFFRKLPIIQDKTLNNAVAMSYLYLDSDVKRLYDQQFFEWNQYTAAEAFAKDYYRKGYDVYIGSSCIGKESVMIYILKNKKPLPIYNRKYFFKKRMES